MLDTRQTANRFGKINGLLFYIAMASSGWLLAVVLLLRSIIGQPSVTQTAISFDANRPVSDEAPRSLRATMTGLDQIKLTWNPSHGRSNITYRIYRSFYAGVEPKNDEVDKLVAEGLVQTNYTDIKLSMGYCYYYIVTAILDGTESPVSNEASATTIGIAHDSPPASNVWPVINIDGTVDIYWTTGTEGMIRYNVYRGITESFIPDNGTLIASCIRGDHYHDSPPLSRNTWYYQVAAVRLNFPTSAFAVQVGGYSYGNTTHPASQPVIAK
jgi:hypothetical protein